MFEYSLNVDEEFWKFLLVNFFNVDFFREVIGKVFLGVKGFIVRVLEDVELFIIVGSRLL